ncbi:MAG TPA: divalent cation tolerance protein CutA [Herpetosiphonaceae bacterium]
MRFVLCNCNPDSAEAIARQVIEKRLVASVNAVPGVQRMYRDADQIRSQRDTLLLMQTLPERLQALTEELVSLTAPDMPAIVSLTIFEANDPYMRWIEANLQDQE